MREYRSRVFTPLFLLTTLLAPLGFILLMLVVLWLSVSGHREWIVAVVDEAGLFEESVLPDSKDKTVYFTYPRLSFDSLYSALTDQKNKSTDFDAILRIPSGFDVMYPNRAPIQFFSDDKPGLYLKQYLSETVSDFIIKKKLKNLQIDYNLIGLDETVTINYHTGIEKEEQGSSEVAVVLGYLMGFIIYISLFVYGTKTLQGVREEKNSRVSEVLMGCVRPFELMAGKIIGIAMVGLTQLVMWIAIISVGTFILTLVFGITFGESSLSVNASSQQDAFNNDEIQMAFNQLSKLNFPIIISVFIFFFIGGYLLYGALFAAIGAAINDESDMQSLILPVSTPIIISVLLLMNVLGEPEGSIAFWASLIPLTSPVIMPSLIPFGPSLWHILLSAFLLVGGFLGATWVAAKIYRTGILMYGKKISLREIVRWVFRAG
ncbi:MAG: ABC transporter permease [Chitinophagales bacterium]|nr:ABC transporter permease [Chitinophagales bacterium]